MMPDRDWSTESGYRFGFNGQEQDDEVAGNGNSYTAEFWQYDSRLARRWQPDPKPSSEFSEYAVLRCNPVLFRDVLGDTINESNATSSSGFKQWKSSKEGRKFISRYKTGGERGEVSINFYVSDKYTDIDGRTLDVTEGTMNAYSVNGDGLRKKIVSEDQYRSYQESGGDMSLYTTKLEPGSYLRFDIFVNNSMEDKHEEHKRMVGLNFLHETQHIRIVDYSIRRFGYLKYGSGDQHVLMLNNMNMAPTEVAKRRPYWAMENGNGIYDFNAERWNYLNDHRLDGETDHELDYKSYKNGLSNLERY